MPIEKKPQWLAEVHSLIEVRLDLQAHIQEWMKDPDMTPSLLARYIVREYDVKKR